MDAKSNDSSTGPSATPRAAPAHRRCNRCWRVQPSRPIAKHPRKGDPLVIATILNVRCLRVQRKNAPASDETSDSIGMQGPPAHRFACC